MILLDLHHDLAIFCYDHECCNFNLQFSSLILHSKLNFNFSFIVERMFFKFLPVFSFYFDKLLNNLLLTMNLDAIIARGPRAISARTNKITSN